MGVFLIEIGLDSNLRHLALLFSAIIHTMNTDPNAVKVLCFGDSNTWGQKPDKTGRHPADIRWTGRLQKLLGDSYYIVEEGLGGRTTDLDDRKPGRNGKAYLVPCLISHTPLDVVVLMLGTNDLKMQYNRSAESIAQAISSLVDDIKQYSQNKLGNPPKVILVSPILINSEAPRFAEFYTGIYDERAAQESRKLATAISQLAEKTGCIFVDAADVAQSGEDGIHFSDDSHEPLARALRAVIIE